MHALKRGGGMLQEGSGKWPGKDIGSYRNDMEYHIVKVII